jgi:uracil-DNA glycosylase family 4
MKHSLLRQKVLQTESKIFNCDKCSELFNLRQKRIHNCPVLGFGFENYLKARVCSICEAPGIYKPHKGEVFIENLEDFHSIYDNRIQEVALIGKRLMSIYSQAALNWSDIQHFNVVCCSPPDYRKPLVEEIVNCMPFLFDRIKLLQNLKVIMVFGKVAKTAIVKGKFEVPIIKTHHPSYLYSYMSNNDREEEIHRVVVELTKVINT